MKLFGPRGNDGLPRRDQHFPQAVPIDAYGNGGFRFAEMSHRGSILCLPSGIHGWDAVVAADIGADGLAGAFAEIDAFDVLLVGTGRSLVPLPAALAARLREAGRRFEAMPTGAAIQVYNIMLGERRKVAAALLAVD